MSDSRLFRAALERTGQCPPQEALERYLDSRDAALASHIETCAFCRTELELLRSFLHSEIPAADAAAVDAIAQRLGRQSVTPPRPVLVPRKPRWSLHLSHVRTAALAAAAILAVVAVGLQWRHSSPPELRNSAGDAGVYRSQSVTVLSPLGDFKEPPAEMHWESTAAAASYRVRLLEVDGNELWSAATSGTTIAFPATVRALMTPAKTLTLTVEAYDTNNQKVAEAPKVNFRILQKIYGR